MRPKHRQAHRVIEQTAATTSLLYFFAHRGIGALLRFGERVHVAGLDNLPRTGAVIVAPNHLSAHDSTLLIGVLPRVVRFVGKAQYVDDWATRFAFLALGNIPVDRANPVSRRRALDAAATVLRSGDVLGVFPEGSRSRDGYLHRGKTGTARLALRTGAPIVPVGLIGTDTLQSLDDPIHVMHLGKDLTVRIGEPICVDRYRDRPDPRCAERALTDHLMNEIGQLSGQAYVDEYTLGPTVPLTRQAAAGVST